MFLKVGLNPTHVLQHFNVNFSKRASVGQCTDPELPKKQLLLSEPERDTSFSPDVLL